jgi:hypothetical protein
MTATQQHQRSWRLMAAMRRTTRTLRYVNDELVRANEAIFRPAGAPPPRPPLVPPPAVSGSADAAAIGHNGQAA